MARYQGWASWRVEEAERQLPDTEMDTYTPCRITGDDGCEVAEVSPVCGMTKEAAIAYARIAYGDDAGIISDAEQWAEWCGDASSHD